MKLALNDCFLSMFQDPARYYYNIGGRWSAKTYDTTQAIIYRLLFVPESKACFMRKVYGSIKDTIFADIIEILKKNSVEYTATVSPLNIKIHIGNQYSEVIFKGADDPEKLKGLSSVDIIMLDEANEFSSQDFETIDQSIRGKHQENSIYLCHNPIPKVPGELFWFERLFKVPKERGSHSAYYDEHLGANVCTMRTTFLDNQKCPEHVKRRLTGYKETNPSLYKLWALGEYSELKGLILSGWDTVKEVPDGVDLLGFGLDFGFSNDPAAMVKVWGNSSDLWVKGLIYSTGLSNKELYDKIIEHEVGIYDTIYADAAEPKTISELYNLGLSGISKCKKKANYKAEMANFLKGRKIHLIEGDTNLQREFSTWSWMQDRTGAFLPKPADGNDHYIDALIMLMYTSGYGDSLSWS